MGICQQIMHKDSLKIPKKKNRCLARNYWIKFALLKDIEINYCSRIFSTRRGTILECDPVQREHQNILSKKYFEKY